ncbi:MAG: ATP synthase subunit I [Syntrophaceae bacterium]|nr:ATP synthase subunit I [Syntrophaceae bacterium]
MNLIEKDPLQRKIEIANWILLGVLLLLSLLFTSTRFALGVFFGGLISIINFHWLYKNLQNVFARLSGSAKSAMMFKYYIRLAVTAVVLFLIITSNKVDVVGLLIGLSIVVFNLVLTVIMTLSKKNCLEEVK